MDIKYLHVPVSADLTAASPSTYDFAPTPPRRSRDYVIYKRLVRYW